MIPCGKGQLGRHHQPVRADAEEGRRLTCQKKERFEMSERPNTLVSIKTPFKGLLQDLDLPPGTLRLQVRLNDPGSDLKVHSHPQNILDGLDLPH